MRRWLARRPVGPYGSCSLKNHNKCVVYRLVGSAIQLCSSVVTSSQRFCSSSEAVPPTGDQQQQHQNRQQRSNLQARQPMQPLEDDPSLPHDARLARKYGPLSQVQCKFSRRTQTFRANVTFRQCGFPVEVVATEAATAEEATQNAVDAAMKLDVIFLDPRIRVATASSLVAHTKGTFDDLRVMCTNAGRMIRFSIHPLEEGQGFTCRVFVRDDWAATSHLVPLVETNPTKSANEALNNAAMHVFDMYRAEFASPAVVKEDYLELKSHLFVYAKKTMTDNAQEEPATRSFGVVVTVTDEYDNSYQMHVKGAKQMNQAYTQVSRNIFRVEFDRSAVSRPLLSKVRWQVEAIVNSVYGGDDLLHYVEEQGPSTITGRLTVGTVTLAEETGQGTYRVELKAYISALRTLLAQHSSVAVTQHAALPFLTINELNEAVEAHDKFDILNAHRGKWNPFAVLGTLTSSLLGSYYQSQFEDVPEGAHVSVRSLITLNDGINPERLLIKRLAKEKGDSWRQACQDAIRENFPEQHEALLKVDEYAQSISRLLDNSARMRALPREKRVPHFSSLFNMLQVFAP